MLNPPKFHNCAIDIHLTMEKWIIINGVYGIQLARVKIWTPKKTAVIFMKLDHCGFKVIHPNYADRMANSVSPDQTGAV